MNVASPDLLTLLAWAEQLAAGQPCAPWEAWSVSAPDAEWKWEQISHAHDVVAGRRQPPETDASLPAEELAQFVEGRLTSPDTQRVEQACWQSTAQLAELVSTARFLQQPVQAEVSSQLQARLLGLVPQPQPQAANGKPLMFRLAGVNDGPPPAKEMEVRTAETRDRRQISKRAKRGPATWQLALAMAAMFILVLLSGTVGWLAATWRQSAVLRQEIARGPSDARLQQQPIDDHPSSAPVAPQQESTPKQQPRDLIRPEPKNDTSAAASDTAPTAIVPDKAAPQPPSPPAGAPKYRPRIAPPTPQLAFDSAQGMLLVDPGQRGKLRVAPSTFSLNEPVRLMSLAESWTKAEAPGVGTLIWEGNSEATMSAAPDGTIEIRLIHGRMGIDNLQVGAQVRVQTGDATWTARAAAPNSTFAVVHDPRSPGLLVPRGALSIDDLNMPGGQMMRWLNGVPQPPEALASIGLASDASQHGGFPPPMNPWDLAWLQAPEENSRRQWRAAYGRIVERLAQSEDVAAELPKVLAATRDPRQAALVARWNIAAVASATRAQQIWTFLNDRRVSYRVAGVKSILEMPPGDERLVDAVAVLRGNVGAPTADRVEQWLAAAWQPGPPNKLQFQELVDGLMHTELAVRQISVSLLELHTEGVLRLAKTSFPAYEAASSRNARQTAQAQWITIMTKLYTPSRKDPNFVTPQAAPLMNTAPQNASPLGTAPGGT